MKNTKQVNPIMKMGQTIPLLIKRLGINGEGIGFYKRQVVFVPGALPGEEIQAEITRVFPNRAEGKIKKIKTKSKNRTTPPCPIYEECGGCQLQHLAYPSQLKEKRDIVAQAFERYTKISKDKLPLEKTIGMKEPWYYRNKSQFQVGKIKDTVIAGLYSSNSHQLINIDHCLVQHEDTNIVTNKVKQIIRDLNIPVYNERKRTGSIRTIVVRTAFRTDQIQLVLVTAKEAFPKKELFIAEVKKRLPQVTSFVQNINEEKTSLIFGEQTEGVYGKDTITEHLGDLSFELSARAFFQLNPQQTVKLYEEVKKQAKLSGKEKVVDAYCGSGTIGMWLADGAKEVRGMDIIKESIIDARKNAEKHEITNTQYETGKAEKLLPKWLKEGWHPDVVVVDPPRTGCDQAFLETVVKIKPKRMVYVSCNPSTLAKDVHMLISNGFEVEKVTPVDMFPQTAQVEAVCTLVLK
ncbi:23S rRNA (uracil(1939)-C(5))-methyltransferase RlmD [Fictibacillus phosphorivorans]|uniref:23S rRNA (uracil(1939)-C(5))-methyltransferase RlmD n=1 Tax=Fictibacillus phosphorivorans TaxID=1221500 RepID=UPI002041B2C1|nr:23S rRNA (uracil(1939)-C(5))-methyltransferase RlmD [Fictibacillus phosphorivorans]MCM3719995.1 23S rRNA (uracil(1939)-C(5))-methyltransferase RlmD [Fictibacillus phosphorivorans]MCM3777648.1 23S rRNA (uracil(1939)-C(5))-methyltransferase RlmD [Fictibacillus phosphorivorans]